MHRFRSFLVALTVASSLAGGVGAGPALAVSSDPASALVGAPLAAATWSSWASARVSTFAGSGGTATAGGTGTAAILRAPTAVAAAAGVLWIAGADYIAKSTISTGATVVATGKPGETGCVDGAPAVARFGAARAAAVDGSYLYTLGQCGLRKTDLTTLVTSTLSTPAGSLNGLVAPGDGYLYASYYSSVVRIDPASGAVSTFASLPGGCGGGRAGAIASDGTTLFVSIQEWNCSGYEAARRINTVKLSDASVASLVVDGRIDTTGGLVALPGFLYTRIDLSTCTGMGCSTPTLRGPRLAQISTADGAVLALAGASTGFADGTGTAAWFAGTASIASDGASLFVADPANNRVRKVVASPAPARAQSSWVSAAAPMFFASVRTVAGGPSATSKAGTGTSAGFNAPTGITVGTVSGKKYAWVGTKDAIMKVDLATGATTVAAGKPGEPGHVDAASGSSSRVASTTELVTDGQDVFFLSEGLLARMAIATGAVSTILTSRP